MGVEQRRAPRFARQLSVDINGLEIFTTDISASGLQVECPTMRFSAFKRAAPNNEVTLAVLMPHEDTRVTVRGQVRYADPTGDAYLIGIQFLSFAAQDDKRWQRYLATMAPPHQPTADS